MTGASSYEDREETARRGAERHATEERSLTGYDIWLRSQGAFEPPPTEPPPTEPPPDTSWVQMTSSRARPPGYVWRPSDARPPHRCDLPAEWEDGAVWRCPLGHLWVVVDRVPPGLRRRSRYWEPATWWQRRRHGGKRARREMANGNRSDPEGFR